MEEFVLQYKQKFLNFFSGCSFKIPKNYHWLNRQLNQLSVASFRLYPQILLVILIQYEISNRSLFLQRHIRRCSCLNSVIHLNVYCLLVSSLDLVLPIQTMVILPCSLKEMQNQQDRQTNCLLSECTYFLLQRKTLHLCFHSRLRIGLLSFLN